MTRRWFRKPLSWLTALAVAATVLLAGPTPAHAAYTPEGLCGSRYVLQGSLVVKYKGLTYGYAHALFNRNNGYWCAVTIKRRFAGNATDTEIDLQRDPAPGGVSDRGNYRYYAGPVYLYQPSDCIYFYGSMGYAEGERYIC